MMTTWLLLAIKPPDEAWGLKIAGVFLVSMYIYAFIKGILERDRYD